MRDGRDHREAEKDQFRLNHAIRAAQVRVLDAAGGTIGILSRDEALAVAEQAELDLVEIAPQADPPVCKIMDYSKFKYEQAKKAQLAKKNQKQTEVKELKFRPNIDDADYQVKLRNGIRFLEEGDKVKFTIRFRGREIVHQSLALKLMQRVEADIGELGTVEQAAKIEGRQMSMLIAPQKKKK